MLILKNARVIRMKEAGGETPVTADVTVDGGLITAVGEAGKEAGTAQGAGAGAAEGAGAGTAEVIDLSGKFLLPGLVDAHCHITYSGGMIDAESAQKPYERVLHAAHNAFVTLLSGVTTLRDPGGIDHIDVAVRDAINEGLQFGPRVVAGGQMICMTGGHGWYFGREADGPEGVRKAAREQIKAHTDWVKFMASGGFAEVGESAGAAQLTMEEMAAGVSEAGKAGKRTAAHAHSAAAIKNAVLAGITSVEHSSFMDDEVIDLILERGVYIDPTFSIYFKMMRDGPRHGLAPYLVDEVKKAWELKKERFIVAYRAGVKVATGTDSGSPVGYHGDLAAELELLVSLGLTPYQALWASVRTSAEMLGLGDKIGVVEPGRRADLVVLGEDPLRNISAVRTVETVVKAGEVYRPGAEVLSLPGKHLKPGQPVN